MSLHRRTFLKTLSFGGASLLSSHVALAQPTDPLRVALIGAGGRGRSLLRSLLKMRNVRVTAICDVDPAHLQKALAEFPSKNPSVLTESDYRKLCETAGIDAVVIATPNHLHSLIAVTAAANGKHVYVEKPVSHNVWEGRQLANAVDRYQVIIQHGFQQRSETSWQDAFAWIKEGHLGKLKIARGFCYKPRPSIGRVASARLAPDGLDFNLWCGPRPLQPIRRKQFHYDWHWQLQWGNGDLGNQGPHQLDICRWALGDPTDMPRSVQSFGNRFAHDDDGEWANTQVIAIDYEKAPVLFEVRGLPKKDVDYQSGMDSYRGQSIGNVIEYEGGTLVSGNRPGCTILGPDGKEMKHFKGSSSHLDAWVKSIETGTQAKGLGAESGHLSSSLAHLGNISWFLGRPSSQPDGIADVDTVEAFSRMRIHLARNGINLEKTPMKLGPKLLLKPGEETFTEEFDGTAAPMLRGLYRKGFEIPI